MDKINAFGTLGGFGATVSDLASVPRNALSIAGRAPDVVNALGFLGGAAAVTAGIGMTVVGGYNALYGADAATKRDGSLTAASGASYTALGAAFIGTYAGKASLIAGVAGAGIAMGAFLSIRTGLRISEIVDFRAKLANVQSKQELLALTRHSSFSRIVGSDLKDAIQNFSANQIGALSMSEIIKRIDQKSFANLATQSLVALLMVAWMVAMIYCAVDPSSLNVNYLFMIPSIFWLFNDSKGVPVFEGFNNAFVRVSDAVHSYFHKPPRHFQPVPAFA